MAHHEWGDGWKHWDDLYEAEEYIQSFFTRATGLWLSSKEKYGTLRYETVMVPPSILDHIRAVFPRNVAFEIEHQLRTWGMDVLTKIIKRAAIKFPQCKDEILDDLWWDE